MNTCAQVDRHTRPSPRRSGGALLAWREMKPLARKRHNRAAPIHVLPGPFVSVPDIPPVASLHECPSRGSATLCCSPLIDLEHGVGAIRASPSERGRLLPGIARKTRDKGLPWVASGGVRDE